LRFFLAAYPGDDTRRAIDSVARAVDFGGGARRVPPTNYHMTLAFAGDVPSPKVAALRRLGTVDEAAFAVHLDIFESGRNRKWR
jgi:2'-5' RNA ligase